MRKRKINRIDKKPNEELIGITDQELKNYFKDSKAKLENHNNPRKYSEIFHEFMSPAINLLLDDEIALKEILDWGLIIWNKGVSEDFPNDPKSKDLELLFPLFKGAYSDKSLIDDFLKRKRELFGNENFFIVKQTSHLGDGGRLAISLAVYVIEDLNPVS